MAEEPRRPVIRPPQKSGSQGSFVSREKVLGDIQEDKIRALENAQADAKRGKAEADEEKRVAAINKLLPDEVAASFGDLPYAIFKERFQTIWDQVAEKLHLSRCYCTYTFEPSPNTSVTIRTLRSKEMKFLRRFTPVTDPADSPAQYMDEDSVFRYVRFVIGVTEYDGNEMPEVTLPKKRLLTPEDMEAWMEDKYVSDRLDFFEDQPEELSDRIAGAFMDVSMAYRYALQENLKNQFAPPSPS